MYLMWIPLILRLAREPEPVRPGDRVTIEGREYEVVDVRDGEPVLTRVEP